ncbi:LacI family DNA-binding transcriptional regulator [Fructilactobacillus frigidiflavus]|uniref:LacI family DNA-binding transcriptional regulator n=1 Tax=Fructilactobacillus frigidiflavus TaxID=3242688 RepID=UPI0037580554
MKSNVTMRDVAEIAGVSIATVSRYLNGKNNHLSLKTAEKVKDAIKKLKYTPDEAARNLVTKKGNLIAVVVSDVNDYFSTEIFKGVSSALSKENYTAVLLDSDNNLKTELSILNSISNQRMFAGIILQPLNTNVKDLEKNLFNDISTIIVDREIKNGIWSSVVTDNFLSSQKACNYFKEQGLNKVIVITNQVKGISTREQRLRGIKSVYGENVKIICPGNNKIDYDKAYQEINDELDKEPKTLIFALKEKWLLEYLPRLSKDGTLKDNLSIQVTGFSDTNLNYIIQDQTKLIKQYPFNMGENAAELLLKNLNYDNNLISKKIELPAEF